MNQHEKELKKYQQRRYRAKYPDKEKARIIKESKNKNNYLGIIYKKLKRKAIKWNVPISTWQEFKKWSLSGVFIDLFNMYRHSNWNDMDRPVIARGMRKMGFLVTNIRWEIARNMGYYDKSVLESEERLNEVQKVYNKGTKEWEKKTIEDYLKTKVGK